MRIVLFNPLSLVRPLRAAELAAEFKSDLVVLPGTHLRCLPDRPFWWQRGLPARCRALHVGYGRGPFTNSSAGVSLLLGPRFRKKNSREIRMPPPTLQGRGLSARFVGYDFDVLVLAAYFPPAALATDKREVRRRAVQALMEWLVSELRRAPTRCTPVLAMDLNSGLGSHGGVPLDSPALGPHGGGEANEAGLQLVELLETFDLTPVNTWHSKGGPTFVHATGASSTIDFVCLPSGLAARVSCEVLWRPGRRVQLIQHREVRDHLPLRVVVPYRLAFSLARPSPTRWSEDAIAGMLQRGVRRGPFLEDVAAAIGGHDFSEAAALMDPAAHWQELVDCIRAAAVKHLTVDEARGGQARRHFREERDRLLAARAAARLKLASSVVAPPGLWTAEDYRLWEATRELHRFASRLRAEETLV